MRNFASTLVKFSKLSHIQTTIWRPPKMAPPRTAGSAGPFVTPLIKCDVLPWDCRRETSPNSRHLPCNALPYEVLPLPFCCDYRVYQEMKYR